VSSVAPCLLCRSPSKFVSPPRCAFVDVNDDRYRRHRRLPSPLPQSATATAKSQRLSFIIDSSDDNHCQLQRRLMAVAVMTSLPPSSMTTTGWWPTARRCRHCCRRRQYSCPCLRCHHHCSLCQSHRPSDAPVNGWLLCHLSPLACVVCRPNLSAPPVVWRVVDTFSAGTPSPFADHRQPLSVALLPIINCLCRSR